MEPAKIYQILAEVTDPEIPVLNILDLGIVRNVQIEQDRVLVTITPTYSGCPAMKTIEFDIMASLHEAGIREFEIKTVLDPAWTTDWMTEEGKKKLAAYGIAAPIGKSDARRIEALFAEPVQPACPQCGSKQSKLLSQFGSTACKALYQCQSCKEPFDYFKCH
jgi:ring-1,2-phenylacetyl-CoA epoxidase subunit PaaD